ncbi:Cache 3/Cache 2 fusion domain-containing protein [Bradyrhizobium sp.]|uniref:Cache 3/Cache 2 fusion domain-containing protein n=1 Tax=Bradyrhizobium sp. TaxID=376 RepID=UPI001E170EF9|nr:Cache 3/Cache 2 fusion domain-containing protein [Bradyrhizobium sp.]MBI5321623.1 Cache 3/Cache 2 fusion domain-containing protein [Bradyrhizobium sp.]
MSGLRITRRDAILSTVIAVALGTPVLASDGAKVKVAMQSLKDDTAKLGLAKLDGEALYFGGSKVNEDYSVVDGVKAKHGGTATLFVKKGNNYMRVSTNVMKEGARAVGTILDPSGPAYAAISQGNTFYGMVDILGKIYDTGYEPIKSESGAIIGVYYVGYPME